MVTLTTDGDAWARIQLNDREGVIKQAGGASYMTDDV